MLIQAMKRNRAQLLVIFLLPMIVAFIVSEYNGYHMFGMVYAVCPALIEDFRFQLERFELLRVCGTGTDPRQQSNHIPVSPNCVHLHG